MPVWMAIAGKFCSLNGLEVSTELQKTPTWRINYYFLGFKNTLNFKQVLLLITRFFDRLSWLLRWQNIGKMINKQILHLVIVEDDERENCPSTLYLLTKSLVWSSFKPALETRAMTSGHQISGYTNQHQHQTSEQHVLTKSIMLVLGQGQIFALCRSSFSCHWRHPLWSGRQLPGKK